MSKKVIEIITNLYKAVCEINMSLYKIEKNNKVQIIKEKSNLLEKDIQKIVGDNLYELMGLKFVDFEFSIEKKRIDILAFDEELNSPVIIELKRINDKGLFDQGMEYFNILSDRKSDFLLKFHEVLKIPAELKQVNWGASLVIFIGKNFTQRQMRAIDFKGIPIELWDYNLYENNLLDLKEVGLDKKVNLDINLDIDTGKTIEKIKKEFKEYDLDFHFSKGSNKTIELFKELRDSILSIDGDIKETLTQSYISYKVNNKNIITLNLQKNKIDIDFMRTEPKDLIDPENKLKYRGNSTEWYNQHISRIFFENIDSVDYILSLIRQAYKKTKNI